MRHPASEKLEIIRSVGNGHLPTKKTSGILGIKRVNKSEGALLCDGVQLEKSIIRLMMIDRIAILEIKKMLFSSSRRRPKYPFGKRVASRYDKVP